MEESNTKKKQRKNTIDKDNSKKISSIVVINKKYIGLFAFVFVLGLISAIILNLAVNRYSTSPEYSEAGQYYTWSKCVDTSPKKMSFEEFTQTQNINALYQWDTSCENYNQQRLCYARNMNPCDVQNENISSNDDYVVIFKCLCSDDRIQGVYSTASIQSGVSCEENDDCDYDEDDDFDDDINDDDVCLVNRCARSVYPWTSTDDSYGPTAGFFGITDNLNILNAKYHWEYEYDTGSWLNTGRAYDLSDVSLGYDWMYDNDIDDYGGDTYPWTGQGITSAWHDYMNDTVTICNGSICWTHDGTNWGLPEDYSDEDPWQGDNDLVFNGEKPFESETDGPTAVWYTYTDPENKIIFCKENNCWRFVTDTGVNAPGFWEDTDGNPFVVGDGEVSGTGLRWSNADDQDGIEPDSEHPNGDTEGLTAAWTYPRSTGGSLDGMTILCNTSVCWQMNTDIGDYDWDWEDGDGDPFNISEEAPFDDALSYPKWLKPPSINPQSESVFDGENVTVEISLSGSFDEIKYKVGTKNSDGEFDWGSTTTKTTDSFNVSINNVDEDTYLRTWSVLGSDESIQVEGIYSLLNFGTPTGLSHECDGQQVKLSWDEVEDAEGYFIEMYSEEPDSGSPTENRHFYQDYWSTGDNTYSEGEGGELYVIITIPNIDLDDDGEEEFDWPIYWTIQPLIDETEGRDVYSSTEAYEATEEPFICDGSTLTPTPEPTGTGSEGDLNCFEDCSAYGSGEADEPVCADELACTSVSETQYYCSELSKISACASNPTYENCCTTSSGDPIPPEGENVTGTESSKKSTHVVEEASGIGYLRYITNDDTQIIIDIYYSGEIIGSTYDWVNGTGKVYYKFYDVSDTRVSANEELEVEVTATSTDSIEWGYTIMPTEDVDDSYECAMIIKDDPSGMKDDPSELYLNGEYLVQLEGDTLEINEYTVEYNVSDEYILEIERIGEFEHGVSKLLQITNLNGEEIFNEQVLISEDENIVEYELSNHLCTPLDESPSPTEPPSEGEGQTVNGSVNGSIMKHYLSAEDDTGVGVITYSTDPGMYIQINVYYKENLIGTTVSPVIGNGDFEYIFNPVENDYEITVQVIVLEGEGNWEYTLWPPGVDPYYVDTDPSGIHPFYPIIDPYPVVTFLPNLVLSGTKPIDTALYESWREIAPIGSSEQWEYSVTLNVGVNEFPFYIRNEIGQESDYILARITRYLYGDINGDNVVNILDYKLFIDALKTQRYYPNEYYPFMVLADMNGDGVNDLLDFPLFKKEYLKYN